MIDWEKTNYSIIDPDIAIQAMINKGYRQVSRKFRIVARVDIPLSEMKKQFIKDNFGDEKSGLPSASIKAQCDYYRRCISNDVIENVPEQVMRELR